MINKLNLLSSAGLRLLIFSGIPTYRPSSTRIKAIAGLLLSTASIQGEYYFSHSSLMVISGALAPGGGG